jgi:hypothetical protein
MVQQPAGPSRLPTFLDFFAKPIVVANGGREQVQRELIGPPAGGRREPRRRYTRLSTILGGATIIGNAAIAPAGRSSSVR